MGFAKYHEDNVSIYVGRMIMRDEFPTYCKENEKNQMKRVFRNEVVYRAANLPITKIEINHTETGRRGLELRFDCDIEGSIQRKLRLNGWWWSKANLCWNNTDTKGNRDYAVGLIPYGGSLSITN